MCSSSFEGSVNYLVKKDRVEVCLFSHRMIPLSLDPSLARYRLAFTFSLPSAHTPIVFPRGLLSLSGYSARGCEYVEETVL